jgi:hypothetical protein
VTDRADWRDFCVRAAADLSLLDGADPVMLDVLSGDRQFCEARYERYTDLLLERFGTLDRFRVLELGGGYGGQAASVLRRCQGVRWAIVDLPEAQQLQSNFLGAQGMSLDDPEDAVDLAFSAYALSELEGDLQRFHVKWFAGLPRGFVVWNGWTTGELPLADLVGLLVEAGLAPDVELGFEHERNALIQWGRR